MVLSLGEEVGRAAWPEGGRQLEEPGAGYRGWEMGGLQTLNYMDHSRLF